ncbi:MAG: aspartate--tRNA ligase [Clostridiales bacterium]|jgi:aspartate--tRNA ligase|nr:aspartate--tRNA ligase [Clostridiales bacterium]
MTGIGDWKRTCMCAEANREMLGRNLTLMGWVQRRRDLGALVFIWLRDRTGIVQVVFDQSRYPDVFLKAQELRSEYVIAVKGELVLRDENNINHDLKTGDVEMIVSELKILSASQTPPFAIDNDVSVNDNIKYKYRYLDLRRSALQEIFALRSRAAYSVRSFLQENGFLELETPVLTRSTPEGARDYLVPSRVHNGEFYALPQSPQLFKQLLMISGFDKYYQIVKCFRDEDLRADRQPEFTQIDVELSFVDTNDVMQTAEGLISRVFKDIKGMDISLPIERLTYAQAMERFGSDKPDMRFGMELQDVSDIVKDCAFSVFSSTVQKGGRVTGLTARGAGGMTRKEIDAMAEALKDYKAKGLAWAILAPDGIRSSFGKFMSAEEMQALIERMDAKNGDAMFFVADMPEISQTAMGQLRLMLGRKLGIIDEKAYRFVWITEFPLFEYSEEDQRYYAKHHPFTAPMDEDINLIGKDNARVRSKAYDIVLNGYELGGGSIRIHDSDMQSMLLEQLGFTQQDVEARFGFLTNALRYGAPPHGGFAIGMDRLVMLLCGTDNIKDVIAFPKMQNARCLLSDAPSRVENLQLDELGIAIVEKQ